jgi:hypothetical protein
MTVSRDRVWSRRPAIAMGRLTGRTVACYPAIQGNLDTWAPTTGRSAEASIATGCRGCREDDGKQSIPVILRLARALEFTRLREKVQKTGIWWNSWDPSTVCCVSVHARTGERTKPAIICRRDSQTAGCPDACDPAYHCMARGHKGDAKAQKAGQTALVAQDHTHPQTWFSEGFCCFCYFYNLGLSKITKVVILHRSWTATLPSARALFCQAKPAPKVFPRTHSAAGAGSSAETSE